MQSQSHTVEIRQPDHVTNMLRDSNLKVPVACGFGVHCQIHVRPLQVDKTGGAWLGMGRVHGLKELQSTSGASQLTVKGPWAWSQDEARDYASKLSNQGAQDMRAAALLERRRDDEGFGFCRIVHAYSNVVVTFKCCIPRHLLAAAESIHAPR